MIRAWFSLCAKMNKTLVATATLALLLSAAPLSSPVAASGAIQRCQSSDGAQIYTDKACAAFAAQRVAMSSDLRFRIASEASREDALASMTGSPDAAVPTPETVTASRRPLAAGCARTPKQLTTDLRAALMLGDVNRVAESYHWAGISSRQARNTLDRLQRLIGKPTVEAHYYNAQISSAPAMADADGAWVATSSSRRLSGNAGMLQLMLGQGAAASFIDLDVERYAGCFFVKF